MKIPLTQGSYEARSIIAEAQRCINLYAEKNPEDAPFPLTHYPTPGLDRLSTGSSISNINTVRCVFRTSNGYLYVCIGNTIYYVSNSFILTALGTIQYATTPVSMQDNGLVILIADNTSNLYAIDISSGVPGTFAQVTDPNIYGATRVDVLNAFFILNVPQTDEWYISLSEVNYEMLTGVTGSILTGIITDAGATYTNGTFASTALSGGSGSGAVATITVDGGLVTDVLITSNGSGYIVGDILSASLSGGSGLTWTVSSVGGTAFDPTDIATKITYPDKIQSLIVMHGEIWLVGALTTEIWYNSGASDFAFQILPGTFVEHGTIAPYSLCKQDLSVYWLSQDEQGQAIFIKGSGYQAKRISTFAIENTLSGYQTVADCIGFTYQQDGHTFVVFSFPGANATWVYDETMQLWHQRCWTDNNGNLNRHRMNFGCNAYNRNIVGDWQNGNLYSLDIGTYVDNVDGLGGNTDGSYPISRIRSWPVEINENNRISHTCFRADMQVGDTLNTVPSFPPVVTLRYSDDRGRTYGNYVQQSLGAQGQYLTNLQWRRLGMARGRIYELSWSIAGNTALNGAWIEVVSATT